MTFQDAEQFLLSLSNLPRKEYMRDPKKCHMYLKRTQALLDILGNPEQQIPHAIHVAGTSGKGSVVCMLHSILEKSGIRVGSTISPHPTHITERWCVGKKTMPRKVFAAAIEDIKSALDTYTKTISYDVPSFFELTMIIGLWYFAKQGVDWIILEAGCGGTFDASNIIPKKDIAIITTIGLDHQDILGKSKSAIAHAKAGIITNKCYVFTNVKSQAIRLIINEYCEKQKAKLSISSKHTPTDIQFSTTGTEFTWRQKQYTTPGIGAHQAQNAALCIDVAEHINIPHKHITEGLAKAAQPLRLEIIRRTPLIIVDGAHNKDKMETTVHTVLQLAQQESHKSVHLLLGFSANKDITTMLKQLSILRPQTIACTRNTINNFRKVAVPEDVSIMAKVIYPHATCESFIHPRDALSWSMEHMKKNAILLVSGSLFSSAQIKQLVQAKRTPTIHFLTENHKSAIVRY